MGRSPTTDRLDLKFSRKGVFYYVLHRKRIYIPGMCLLFLCVYGLKSHLGINLIKSVSLSHYFPFSYLAVKGYIQKEKMGVLFEDNFNRARLGHRWAKAWMSEKGDVSVGLSPDGISNGGHCFRVSNSGTGRWAISTEIGIEVEKGDIFDIQGMAICGADEKKVYFGVSAKDENESELALRYVHEKIPQTAVWTRFEERFCVMEPVRYIHFRFSGEGIGTCCFDDIKIVRESGGIAGQSK